MQDNTAESFSSQSFKQGSESRRHGFYVGNIGLLIPGDLSCELTDKLQTCPIPNTPDWFSGMTNLRGSIAPVFDLGTLFNLPPSNHMRSTGRKLLFLKIEDNWVGFYSDGLPVRLMLNGSQVLETLAPLPDSLKPFITCCYQQKDIWFDCDIRSLLLWICDQFD